MPPDTSYTYEDFALLPEGAPYQLIDGQLVVSPSPSTYHQTLLLRLASRIHRFCEDSGQGTAFIAPIDVYLSDTDVYQPDLVVVRAGGLAIVEPRLIRGAPDLVVEILSPSTAYYDLHQKKTAYERHGVVEYWVVDPIEQSVEVFERGHEGFVLLQRSAGAEAATSRCLSGFHVELESLFQG
ncbi:MAG: Uma2 family endonuclease [Rhodothermales bacterium]|nr:Uma2 family endonuclease [Rhodothermales bacterium]